MQDITTRGDYRRVHVNTPLVLATACKSVIVSKLKSYVIQAHKNDRVTTGTCP